MFEIENLKFSYGKKEILKGIDISINKSDVISILGPNGCGKTTLLKLMLGFLKPLEGKILFDGKEISKIKTKHFFQKVAYIPQVHQVAFGYLVKDIVLMGRMPYKNMLSNYNTQDYNLMKGSLETLGINELENEIYTTLSGGQKQLVLIARAITQQADIFIMDEPVNGLDFGNQYKLLSKIKELSTNNITFIKTSHYPDHVLYACNEAIFMNNGKVLAKGDPKKIITKENIKDVYKIDSIITELNNRKICLAM